MIDEGNLKVSKKTDVKKMTPEELKKEKDDVLGYKQ